ncbi:VOC family protein [Acidisoma sp.]|uniref:VOC family protein n=1 Tax=Acidisoma sp. TaxID=1872115 RepID=UPI003B0062FC
MIDRLDHLVLTVADLGRTLDFYVRGLGLTEQRFENGRVALLFGQHKLNLHEAGGEPILPRAARPTSGSADFCLIADRPMDRVIELLRERAIPIELGPVARTGASGPIRSVYLRDPDDNLVEIAEYV